MPRSAKRVDDARLGAIRLLICDVDGVLTSGELIFSPEGESKVFHVHDGQGLAFARQAGLKVAWVSSRRSTVVQRRARELKIDVLMQGVDGKREAVKRLLRRFRLAKAQACFVGDDWVDLPAFAEVGYRFAVANAVPEVKAVADRITVACGGAGGVREVVECILKAQGIWKGVTDAYRA